MVIVTREKFSYTATRIQDITVKESDTGVDPCPRSFVQDLCSQQPGEGIIGRTDGIISMDRKAQLVVSTTYRCQIKTLPGIDPNACPDPDPATAASLESQILQ